MFPKREEYARIAARPHLDFGKLEASVDAILADVRQNGDKAVAKYGEMFDGAKLASLEVTDGEKAEAELSVSRELKEAIELAHKNIETFHRSQQPRHAKVATSPGVTCWQKSVPIQKVGLYVPGGSAPLFSTVLMLATPANIAGCGEIVLCTPPQRDGKVHPAVVVAARIAGVGRIFKAGGVQAIGAMAYGTETIPKVYKIFGPGNQYVMAAKQRVSLRDVAIDMPAGPSEVCVVADEGADAAFVAADLLSQAEHGPDSQVLLVTTSESLIGRVKEEIGRQLAALPRMDIAAKALGNSKIVLVADSDEAIRLSNAYAPEHLIIQTADCDALAEKVVNAGSVFLGKYACESAGDYASGTNHTLPTSAYAKAYSGVNLDSFCRKITFQSLTEEGARNIGPAVMEMAAAESLDAHKNAMALRMEGARQR